MKHAKILVADDERAITEGLSAILADEGYEVVVAFDGQQALDKIESDDFGVVLADLKMPKRDGLAILKQLQHKPTAPECIIITGQGTVDTAVAAMRQGAYDYIEKPLNAEKLNRLKALIPKALERHAMQQRNRELTSTIEGLTHYGELTGQSEEMRAVYQLIEAVAQSTASVFILGESGTGKELVARAIHNNSDRAQGIFFALNCAALPKDILENELFGHEKGAFTGSVTEKAGAFELADGGTLFLDEVAEMPPDIQVKLLRSIETRTIRRLGGKKEIEVDIRILAASNRDLQKALADGDLRDDLYYRLSVVEIYLPPLRDRAGDIKLLANEFLGRFAKENSKKITGFTDSAWQWILAYHWPGNVRELKNAVERAVIMARGDKVNERDITPRHIRPLPELPALSISSTATVAEARRQLVLRTFASTGGDHERTAKIVGLSPSEVRQELTAMVNSTSGNGAQPRAGGGGGGGGARTAGAGRGAKAASRAPAKTSKGKNR
jgi:two-component system response regulator PilR (NtrC family)